jgi:hypothetical protein
MTDIQAYFKMINTEPRLYAKAEFAVNGAQYCGKEVQVGAEGKPVQFDRGQGIRIDPIVSCLQGDFIILRFLGMGVKISAKGKYDCGCCNDEYEM